LVFLVVDFLLLPLVPILFFAFVFDLDLVAFLVVGPSSRLVVVIGLGGVEGSVGSGGVEGSVGSGGVEGSVDSVDIILITSY
jgi:hypothetical protein